MTLNDLPEIKIVRHASAKHLRLRVEPNAIRLTVPPFCSNKQIQAFIQQSTTWLLETWRKQQQKITAQPDLLPTELKLFNLEQPITIQQQSQKKAFIYDVEHYTLTLSDQVAEAALKAFCMAYAKQQLPLYLEQLSLEIGLAFAKCNIRQAKTRWGSCSGRHDIMLNAALILFPIEQVRYVCVHELAHTKHFDHSPQFWMEVQQHDAEFKQHRKDLKSGRLPYWWHLN